MSMRIGGLASGMDIDQIVSDLMKVEQMKVDKLVQDKELLEWKQQAYNDLNLKMANFILDTKKDLGLTQTTTTGVLFNTSVSSLDWVKEATSSDETIASVSASATASEGTYSITVDKLAENFSAASSTNISDGDKANLSTQFNDINAGDTIEFTIETDLGTKTFTYNGGLDSVSITDIVDDINSSNLGVTVSYDSAIDRFFLQTDNTGSSSTIKISDTSILTGGNKFMTGVGSVLQLKCDENRDGLFNEDFTDGMIYSGVDAQLDFGAATNIIQSSNKFSINGINFELKKTGSFTVQVGTDINGVYEKIESFVESYNSLVDEVYGELRAERYRDYLPLTDDQKEAMTEKEIELWEEKAKSGLLRNDSILEGTMSSVRGGLYDDVIGVSGIFSQLTEIGISTEAYTSGSLGKLVIDETKLKEAIQNDVDSVLELMFKEPSDALKTKSEDDMTSAELQQKRSESGLINRMYDNIITGMKSVINKAGAGDDSTTYRNVKSSILVDFVSEYGGISMLDSDISYIDDDIYDMNERLVQIEDRYWSQFTAMEKAISQMNQQSAWLSQQMGGM